MTRGLLGILLLFGSASAVELSSKDAVHLEEIRAAHQLKSSKRYPEAIDAFERLYFKLPDPRFLLNIAVLHQLVGRCSVALRTFDRFAQGCQVCGLETEEADARSAVEEACLGRLIIKSVPPGAAIQVDAGEPVLSPVDTEIVAGGHVVSVALPGYRVIEAPVVVKGGQTRRLELVLTKTESPADRVFTQAQRMMQAGRYGDAAALYATGEQLQSEPRFALGLGQARLAMNDCTAAGTALDRFDAQCMTDCPLVFLGKAAREDWRAACVAEPEPVEQSAWRWIALGVGAAGVLTGGLFASRYVDAVDERDAAQRRGDAIAELRALHDDATTDYQWMQASFIVGSLGAAAAIGLWMFEGPSGPSAQIQAGPTGLRLIGRF